ncbi:MAG: hypothetical protein Q4E35_06005 [Eubacteriales bacterium]|nr:hypothetical protein [Eubacteriales bacterium]
MAKLKTTTEYSYDDMSIDDILSEFGIGGDFSDPEVEYEESVKKPTPSAVKKLGEEKIDSRFNLGGKVSAPTPAGRFEKLDLSADESYVPKSSETFESVHRQRDGQEETEAPEEKKAGFVGELTRGEKRKKAPSFQPRYEAEEEAEEEEAERKSKKKSLLSKLKKLSGERKEKTEEPDGFESDDDSEKDVSSDADAAQGYFPASFREYLTSLAAGGLMKLRGFNRRDVAATMTDTDEDLGQEVSLKYAYKYYGSFIKTAKLRILIAAAVTVLLLLISLGLPVPGMLKCLPVNAAMCLTMQLTVMLLGVDVVTNGILKICRLRPGADSLAVICCLLTAIDAVIVITSNSGVKHLPLCAASTLCLMGTMLSSYLTVRSFRKTLRVPTIAKSIYSVVGQNDLTGKELTLVKTSRTVTGFVRRLEEASPDETIYERLSPFILPAALVMSLIVSAVTGNIADIFYILSVILCVGTPVCALLCFALPFFVGSMRLFSSGASICGWSGLCDIGQSNNLIVTDRDIFPPDCVSIETIRIFADEDAQKVISYAASMMIASSCVMAKAFSDEMEQNNCSIMPIENFEVLSGGGFKGQIDGETVLCGSAELMRLMNVKIPFRLMDKTTVLLAIDGTLFGIFTMKYEVNMQVRKALIELMRSNRHPVFALRDFNMTPDMLKTSFDIATDGYDFPPYLDRFKITETKPSRDSQIAAVVCREGLTSLTATAETGSSIYSAVKLNLMISIVGAAVCMLAVMIKMLVGTISLNFVLLLMLLLCLPVLILSVMIK